MRARTSSRRRAAQSMTDERITVKKLSTMHRFARAGLLLGLPAIVLVACDSSPSEPGNGHVDTGRVEIEIRGASPPVLLAEWIDGEGWNDGEGNPLSELPASVRDEDGSIHPLVAGGPNTSLDVRFYWPDGTLQEMSTLPPGWRMRCSSPMNRFGSAMPLSGPAFFPLRYFHDGYPFPSDDSAQGLGAGCAVGGGSRRCPHRRLGVDRIPFRSRLAVSVDG
jgi:hypothetical protein